MVTVLRDERQEGDIRYSSTLLAPVEVKEIGFCRNYWMDNREIFKLYCLFSFKIEVNDIENGSGIFLSFQTTENLPRQVSDFCISIPIIYLIIMINFRKTYIE